MTHRTDTSLRDTALACLARGWSVFPLAPGGKLPAIPSAHPDDPQARATCRGACDRFGHGVHDATRDPDVVRHWWTHCPQANIGLSCGASGLVVIDLDTLKVAGTRPPQPWDLPGVTDGADVLAVLCEHHNAAFPSETYTVRTGRGGLHLYFQAPAGTELRNTAGTLGWLIDTRAAGGYVLAAGSSVNGCSYTVIHDTEPAPLPTWLLRLLTAEPHQPVTSAAAVLGSLERPVGYAGAALRGEVQRVLDSEPNQHNNTLNHAAYALGRLVGGGLLPRGLVFEALCRAGEAVGQGPREAAATVNSGLRAGIAKPRRGGAA